MPQKLASVYDAKSCDAIALGVASWSGLQVLKRGRLRLGTQAAGRRAGGHGERPRLQLLFQSGGAENLPILAVNALVVNVLAVNRPLPLLYTQYM